MQTAIHHHQVLHAASQAVVTSHPALLDTLPPWAGSPIFLTFAPCAVVLSALMIRHRVNLHRRGERFTKSKTKPAEMVGGVLVMGALFYFKDKYPLIPLILDWPDRTFPYYRAHGFEMWVGFFAAAVAARVISALYASLFLRSGGPRHGHPVMVDPYQKRHTLLPNPPDGYGWFSSPATTRTRTISRRTFHDEEE